MATNNKKNLTALCRESGLRLTKPRKAILRALEEATDHPDAVELHRRVSVHDPSISLATVYRTVNVLGEKGLLEKLVFSDGKARFESADQEHHDHLIDVETGDVTEFRSDEIERLQEEIARAHGFTIVSHKLDIYVRRAFDPPKDKP